MRPNSGRQNSSFYCHYHRDRGHDTGECRQLRDEIESLIRCGHLRGCTKDDRGKKPAAAVPDQPAERVVNMIFGGTGAGGDSNRARKAYARQGGARPAKRSQNEESNYLMTFGPLDAAGIDPEHDDALVITVRISNSEVQCVMVDTGSSTDILYWSVLKRMGHNETELSPYNGNLHGITGDIVRPKGTIDLYVTVGSAPRTRTFKMQFLVVDLPTAYNAILGRPTLNKLCAAMSTFHKVMNFSTESEVREARSDPKLSRECHLTSLRLPLRPTDDRISGPKRSDQGAPTESPDTGKVEITGRTD